MMMGPPTQIMGMPPLIQGHMGVPLGGVGAQPMGMGMAPIGTFLPGNAQQQQSMTQPAAGPAQSDMTQPGILQPGHVASMPARMEPLMGTGQGVPMPKFKTPKARHPRPPRRQRQG